MPSSSGITFAGETNEYRKARQKLLNAERKLRREVEKVAALRRELPDGHVIPSNYVFEEYDATSKSEKTVKMSELFTVKGKSLVLYSFMYAKGATPCPMCTSFLDALNGAALHASKQVNLAVVARGPVKQLRAYANKRKWNNLRMLSSANNRYNQDYLAEAQDGSQLPMLNVFKKTRNQVRHFYTTEIFFAPNEPGQHPRHMDFLFPMWALFDLTKEGRPNDWFPQTEY